MAQDLCAQADVGIDQVRVLKLGETRVANALVAGLWPWLRRIYITDHMLATFSVAEIRAILAHEVGHIRHRHLWWYLGFAIGGVFVIPRLFDALAQFELLSDSLWTVVIALGLYWGVMFKFLSRRFERQADRFAVAATGDVVTFQSALERLRFTGTGSPPRNLAVIFAGERLATCALVAATYRLGVLFRYRRERNPQSS